MEGGGERKRKAGPLELDWTALLSRSDSDDEPPPEVVIQEAATEKSKPPVVVMVEKEEEESHPDHYLRELSNKELVDKITRAKQFLNTRTLADGGAKLRANLKRQEAELERRTRMKDDNNCKKVISIADESTCNGATDDLSCSGAPPSVPASVFALRFCGKLDIENKNQKAAKSFSEELSTLNCSEHRNVREHTLSAAPRTQKICSSSRQTPFKSPRHLSSTNDNRPRSNGEHWESSHSSNPSPRHSDKDVLGCSHKKGIATRVQPPRNTRRNNKTLVLLDEEEIEVDVIEEGEQVGRSSKEAPIYYPSRDDPKAFEIHYSDMQCLAPESYLSSPIMNFYILYLQKPTSPRSTRRCDYHIFNTYFYKKLKQDVLAKADKETSFLKFRRWWKDVNIFEKAYIFLPIHENQHWSLVIICIPAKEDGLGPSILHLDSLGLHDSKSMFNNVRSFLIEEWNFLRQEELLPELPILDNIWDNLPRRISEKVIEVPQQKNEYDCGLFVLYFIERFLEEAPERLKRGDFEMFGRQWFKPEEASSLRRKIKALLREEFKKVDEGKS